MRLITTCPACEATFYVSPEQLSAHRGDVRCGKCNHVFNALDALNQLDQNKISETNKHEAEVVETKVVASNVPATQLDEAIIQDQAEEQENVDIAPEPEPEPEPETQSEPIQALSDEVAEDVPSPTFAIDEPTESFVVPVESASDEAVVEEQEAADLPPEPQVELSKTSVKPSLVEPVQAKTGAQASTASTPTFSLDILNGSEKTAIKSKSSASKWLLALFSLILLLAACLQGAYFMRTEIASKWPITKPYLSMACQHIGCTVALARHAELIIIEDSDLQEDATHTGVINLSTTLINQAKYIQAYPLLELTLTDTLEKPKLRRIFTPQEYLAKDIDIDKGVAAGGEVQIKLTFTTNGEPVTGYRVFVSY